MAVTSSGEIGKAAAVNRDGQALVREVRQRQSLAVDTQAAGKVRRWQLLTVHTW